MQGILTRFTYRHEALRNSLFESDIRAPAQLDTGELGRLCAPLGVKGVNMLLQLHGFVREREVISEHGNWTEWFGRGIHAESMARLVSIVSEALRVLCQGTVDSSFRLL